MNQGTQGYSLTKKTEGQKSRDTVSLITAAQKYNIVNTTNLGFFVLNFLQAKFSENSTQNWTFLWTASYCGYLDSMVCGEKKMKKILRRTCCRAQAPCMLP
jgi:hypothetical protein